jgi:hypothetical protein
MADLTPEEKKRIYEQEKARLEAEEKTLKDAEPRKSSTRVLFGVAVFIIIAVAVVGYIYHSVFSGSSPSSLNSDSVRNPIPPGPISIASNFDVKVNKFSTDEYGYYQVVGEIKNISQKTFQFVDLQAEYLDANTRVVGTETTFACGTDFILPGKTKPFKFMGTNQPDYKSVRVGVTEAREVR